VRIIKLGGSLLEIPELADRLENWLRLQSPMATWVVVGGGAAANVVRELDRANRLDESTAHWLAIRAMQFNAHLVAALLSGATLLKSFDQPSTSEQPPGVWVVDPWAMLRQESPQHVDPLPESWDVTSDSIAAWIATTAKAKELVLLKSTLLKRGRLVQDAVESEYVDRYFAHAAQSLPRVRCVNFQDESFPELDLAPNTHIPSLTLVVPPPVV